MKLFTLPETHAPRLNLECVCSDGGSYTIHTRRCSSVRVSDDVVNVIVTPLNEAWQVLSAPVHHLRIQQCVTHTVG